MLIITPILSRPVLQGLPSITSMFNQNSITSTFNFFMFTINIVCPISTNHVAYKHEKWFSNINKYNHFPKNIQKKDTKALSFQSVMIKQCFWRIWRESLWWISQHPLPREIRLINCCWAQTTARDKNNDCHKNHVYNSNPTTCRIHQPARKWGRPTQIGARYFFFIYKSSPDLLTNSKL